MSEAKYMIAPKWSPKNIKSADKPSNNPTLLTINFQWGFNWNHEYWVQFLVEVMPLLHNLRQH